jgi:hypothetical protein
MGNLHLQSDIETSQHNTNTGDRNRKSMRYLIYEPVQLYLEVRSGISILSGDELFDAQVIMQLQD